MKDYIKLVNKNKNTIEITPEERENYLKDYKNRLTR